MFGGGLVKENYESKGKGRSMRGIVCRRQSNNVPVGLWKLSDSLRISVMSVMEKCHRGRLPC